MRSAHRVHAVRSCLVGDVAYRLISQSALAVKGKNQTQSATWLSGSPRTKHLLVLECSWGFLVLVHDAAEWELEPWTESYFRLAASIKFCGVQWSGSLNWALFQTNVINPANLLDVKVKFTGCVNRYPVDIHGKWKLGQTANNSTRIEKCVKCNASLSSHVSNKFQKSSVHYCLTHIKFGLNWWYDPRPRSGPAKPPGNRFPNLHGDG